MEVRERGERGGGELTFWRYFLTPLAVGTGLDLGLLRGEGVAEVLLVGDGVGEIPFPLEIFLCLLSLFWTGETSAEMSLLLPVLSTTLGMSSSLE